MKTLLSIAVGIGVALSAMADDANVRISSGVADILKLSQAQVSTPVLEAYIANSQVAYSPSPDEIVYLKKQGVPDGVVAAMIRHGSELRAQAAPPAQAMQPPPGGVPMPQTVAPPVPDAGYPVAQPAPVVQQPAPVTYAASYPYSDYYGDYYWGPGYWGWGGLGYVWIGPGWRYGGWGRGGFHGGFGGFHGGFHGGVGGVHGGFGGGHGGFGGHGGGRR